MGANRTGLKGLDGVARDARVKDVWSESNGLWIALAPGFNFEGCGSLREDTVKKLLTAFRAVEEGEPS